MELLHRALGNSTVQAIVKMLGAPPQSTTLAPGQVRVNAPSGLNVRSTPDSEHNGNVVGLLPNHHVVTAHRQDGEWLAIEHQGKPAFVNGTYVERADAAKVPEIPKATADTPVVEAQHPQQQDAANDASQPTAPKSEAEKPSTPAHADDHAAAAPSANAPAPEAAPPPTKTPSAPAQGTATPKDASPSATTSAKDPAGGPTTATTPAPAPPQSAPQATAGSYLAKYTSLGGTNIADLKTTTAEAKILNAVRSSDKRFDPAWLTAAQGLLGVAATGSFNTETLRALLIKHPHLDGKGIIANQDNVLTGLAPGKPFIETDHGFGDAAKGSQKGETKADRAAHALGYADYATYLSKLLPTTFLSVPLNTGQGLGLAHPHLQSRLAVAETFLRQRHAGMSDHEVVKAIGWNGKGNASYAEDTKWGTSHFHTMGLAIDVDVSHNPYLFTGRQDIKPKDDDKTKEAKGQNNWWMDMFEKHLAYAAKLFGGEKISAAVMDRWAQTMSTDELFAHVHEISSSFGKYMDLAKNTDDAAVLRVFTAAGVPADKAKADLAEFRKVPHYFHDFYSRGQATGLTTHSQELLVALRDVAGLSWGGAEMSSNENGDFMHSIVGRIASEVCSRASTSRSRRCATALLALAIGVSCKASTSDAEGAPPSPTPTAKSAPIPPAASAQAKKVADVQAASFKSGAGSDAIAQFDSGSVALAGAGHEVDDPDVVTTLAQIGPHDTVLDVKVAKLNLGGNDKAAWLLADFAVAKRDQEPGEAARTTTEVIHATELLTAAASWKIVAGAFSPARNAGRRGAVFPMIEPTQPGPLAALLASPDAIAKALSSDPNVVMVNNDGATATGPDAVKAMLAKWHGRPMSVDGKVREVVKDKVGFVQANVNWNEPGGAPYRFSGQLVALQQADGSWSVVALQYLAL
jgi:hypothetical protein